MYIYDDYRFKCRFYLTRLMVTNEVFVDVVLLFDLFDFFLILNEINSQPI